jgi:hypothetical protein
MSTSDNGLVSWWETVGSTRRQAPTWPRGPVGASQTRIPDGRSYKESTGDDQTGNREVDLDVYPYDHAILRNVQLSLTMEYALASPAGAAFATTNLHDVDVIPAPRS